MATSTSHFRPTPGTAAKDYAKANPQFVGRLVVVSYTPAGSGGHKIKSKNTHFLVDHGRVAQQARSLYFRNGICVNCGTVYLSRALNNLNPKDLLDVCDPCRQSGKPLSHNHDFYRVDLQLDIRSLQAGLTGAGPVVQFTEMIRLAAITQKAEAPHA